MSRRDAFRLVDVFLGCMMLTAACWPVLGYFGVFLGPGLLMLQDDRMYEEEDGDGDE